VFSRCCGSGPVCSYGRGSLQRAVAVAESGSKVEAEVPAFDFGRAVSAAPGTMGMLPRRNTGDQMKLNWIPGTMQYEAAELVWRLVSGVWRGMIGGRHKERQTFRGSPWSVSGLQ
jgi:hypothetical protein